MYVSNEESYTFWLRGSPPNAAGGSLYVGVNEVITNVTGFAPGEWSWSKITPNDAPATAGLEPLKTLRRG